MNYHMISDLLGLNDNTTTLRLLSLTRTLMIQCCPNKTTTKNQDNILQAETTPLIMDLLYHKNYITTGGDSAAN